MPAKNELKPWIKSIAGWLGVTTLVAVLGLGLFHFYRGVWEKGKRLRVAVPGRLYRSGQLTVAGFADAVHRYGIRSVVNVQQEFPDPSIRMDYISRATIGEQEMCKTFGVKYIHVKPDLISSAEYPKKRPAVLDDMLAVYDDRATIQCLFIARLACTEQVYSQPCTGWSIRAGLWEKLTEN